MNRTVANIAAGFVVRLAGVALAIYVGITVAAYVSQVFGAAGRVAAAL